MNTGKTLFAQLMEFLPWKTFSRIVARHGGDSRVRTLSCGEQYRAMAFAQLTYRESLRDIETCLIGAGVEAVPHGFQRACAPLASALTGTDPPSLIGTDPLTGFLSVVPR